MICAFVCCVVMCACLHHSQRASPRCVSPNEGQIFPLLVETMRTVRTSAARGSVTHRRAPSGGRNILMDVAARLCLTQPNATSRAVEIAAGVCAANTLGPTSPTVAASSLPRAVRQVPESNGPTGCPGTHAATPMRSVNSSAVVLESASCAVCRGSVWLAVLPVTPTCAASTRSVGVALLLSATACVARDVPTRA